VGRRVIVASPCVCRLSSVGRFCLCAGLGRDRPFAHALIWLSRASLPISAPPSQPLSDHGQPQRRGRAAAGSV